MTSKGTLIMDSSRIFIRGLPPTLSEADFRKHFSAFADLTDAKFLPRRRIGYVGYKSHVEAQKAVKYYNKSYIRMSRIGVELARPVHFFLLCDHYYLANRHL